MRIAPSLRCPRVRPEFGNNSFRKPLSRSFPSPRTAAAVCGCNRCCETWRSGTSCMCYVKAAASLPVRSSGQRASTSITSSTLPASLGNPAARRWGRAVGPFSAPRVSPFLRWNNWATISGSPHDLDDALWRHGRMALASHSRQRHAEAIYEELRSNRPPLSSPTSSTETIGDRGRQRSTQGLQLP